MAKTDMEKLQVLINHWIEHNEEHADEFMKWAERARAAGKDAVYDDILKAIGKLRDANSNLRAALESL